MQKSRRSCLVLGFVDRGTTHWGLWETAGSSSRAGVTLTWRNAGKVLGTFLAQAYILQHVSPLPTLSSVAVFEVLPEVIGPEEFLCLVALAKLVDIGEVVNPAIPVRLWEIWELFSAIATCVSLRTSWARRCW
jgi:hypothetical protein